MRQLADQVLGHKIEQNMNIDLHGWRTDFENIDELPLEVLGTRVKYDFALKTNVESSVVLILVWIQVPLQVLIFDWNSENYQC